MKTFYLKPIFLTLAVAFFVTFASNAQRVVKGTVYLGGKVAPGVNVEAHKGKETFMTSFDGVYQITVPENSKYIKFTFIDDARKLSIEGNNSDVIDFSFDGKIPEIEDGAGKGVNLKSMNELIAAQDKDFLSTVTLEKQFYEQKDFKTALYHWRKLYKTYPKSTLNIYLHGLNMYQDFIERTSDIKTKNKYIDTLMMVYDQRIKYFDQKGFNLGRQGTDYLKYKISNENLTDLEKKPILKKGYNYVSESVALQGNESEVPVLLLMMQTTRGLFGMGEFDKAKVIENYEIVSKHLNNHLQKQPNSAELLSVRDMIDQFFQTSGAADCDALISIYTPKFNQIAANIDDLKKMIRMLDRQKCDDSPLFAKASEKLYSMEPSAEAAYNMARLFVKSNQMDKAEVYYKQAIGLEKDQMLLSKYYIELAQLNYGSPQVARGYAKKSIENNPSNGKAYILLGNIYAHNSKSFGENDFERSQIFWVAVDYFNKAKRADSSVEAEANEGIALYSQYFPSKEDIFFYGLTVGNSISLGSWVGETTTIRDKK